MDWLRRHRAALLLAAAWLIATAFNLTKPLVMDDAYYVDMADKVNAYGRQALVQPMVLTNGIQAMAAVNQPLGLIWLYALTMKVFGPSLFALHVLMSLFTLAAAVGMYRLARRAAPRLAPYAAAAVVLGPGFLPGQNLMTDIPLIAVWIWIFVFVAAERTRWWHDAAVGALLAYGVLIKYPTLAIVPAVALIFAWRRQWRRLWALAIPIAVAAWWSIDTAALTGTSHLLSRAGRPLLVPDLVVRALNWVIALGAVWPAGLILGRWRRKETGLLALVSLFFASFGTFLDPSWQNFLVRSVFILSAMMSFLIVWRAVREEWRSPERRSAAVMIAAWILAGTAFIIIFSPFIAVRHVLLVIPPVALATAIHLRDRQLAWRPAAALGVTILLGCLLGLSDYTWARADREAAVRYHERYGRIWPAGTWNWQWEGMHRGDQVALMNGQKPGPGDIVLVAANINRPRRLLSMERMEMIEDVSVPAMPWTLIRTMLPSPAHGYYGYSFPGLPWYVSTAPLERFIVYRVR